MSALPALTLITSSECHLCEHGRRVMAALQAESSIEVHEIAWESDEAASLRDGASLFPPAVYLNRQLLGYGRLSEGALRKRLCGPES